MIDERDVSDRKSQRRRDEEKFRDRLADWLRKEPYAHQCTTEVTYKFPSGVEVDGHKGGRVDIYVRTNPQWPHHAIFPVIAIECKLEVSLGWLIKAQEQVRRYHEARQISAYKRKGVAYEPPSIFLVCTPASWHEGWLYKWNEPSIARLGELALQGAWTSSTMLYERFAMRHGATVLRLNGDERGFFTNQGGNHGAIHWRGLETPSAMFDPWPDDEFNDDDEDGL